MFESLTNAETAHPDAVLTSLVYLVKLLTVMEVSNVYISDDIQL